MSEPGGARVWDETFAVRSFDVDRDGDLTPMALFCWLLEAAGRHARALGWGIQELQREGQTWMLSRCLMEVRHLPRWGDTVTVRTWPSGIERLFALRELRLLDGQGETLARATSAWLLLQADTRRPLRPPPELVALAEATPGRGDELPWESLPELEHAATAGVFRPRSFDLDINGHVTAASLLRWVLESLSDETLTQRRLAWLAIEFRAEVRLGDDVLGEVEPHGGGMLHCLRRVRDGRPVVRGRTAWRSR